MTTSPVLLAHGGGWDERVVLLAPVAGAVVLAWLVLRRARSRRQRVPGLVFAAVFLAVDLVALGRFGLDDRATAIARNLLFPGLGLFEESTLLATAFVAAGLLAIGAWTKLGTDWVVALVWVAAIAVGLLVVGHPEVSAQAGAEVRFVEASHEFAAVMLVVAFVVHVRTFLSRLPGVRTLRRRRQADRPVGLSAIVHLRTVERTRVAAIAAIAERLGGSVPQREVVISSLRARSVRRRARLVGAVARGRFRGDPLRVDSAPTRAALVLWGGATAVERQALRDDANSRWAGVPASEPTWVRLLDGTLAAAALADLEVDACTERWVATWIGPLALRGGHRPSCLYTPLAIGGAWAPAWEHAAASALAHVLGWNGDGD